MRLEQKLGIQIYFSPYDDYLMTGFSGAGNLGVNPLKLESGPRGIKLVEEGYSVPLVRVDYPEHGKNPPLHLQYGGGESDGCNPERSGNEAADIFAQIIVETKHPLSLWNIEEDENKD